MMRGASADAYAAAAEVLPRSGDTGRVAQDLFGVADLVRSEPGLRRVATDVSVPGDAKAGLVRDVLSGKVSAEALLDHFAILKGIADRRARGEVVEALLRQTNLWEVRRQKLGGSIVTHTLGLLVCSLLGGSTSSSSPRVRSISVHCPSSRSSSTLFLDRIEIQSKPTS